MSGKCPECYLAMGICDGCREKYSNKPTSGHEEIIKRLREENESLKKEMKMLYEKLADAAIREEKLLQQMKEIRGNFKETL